MEDVEFSPENLQALNQGRRALPPGVNESPGRRLRQSGPFIKGPVPMVWIDRAYRATGGNGLRLGLSLWWVSGMVGSQTFSVNITGLKTGQSPRSKRRALKALEEAGLLCRTHEPGKRLRVELLDLEGAAPGMAP